MVNEREKRRINAKQFESVKCFKITRYYSVNNDKMMVIGGHL